MVHLAVDASGVEISFIIKRLVRVIFLALSNCVLGLFSNRNILSLVLMFGLLGMSLWFLS